MSTKEQESQALAEIRKIVEGLGTDSYIGTAFEGCFEIAEQNIANDFMCSMKQRAESIQGVADKINIKNVELKNELNDKDEEIRVLKTQIETKDVQIKQLNEMAGKYSEESIANWNKYREQEDRAENAEAEIIKLKAKLYDLLIGNKE